MSDDRPLSERILAALDDWTAFGCPPCRSEINAWCKAALVLEDRAAELEAEIAELTGAVPDEALMEALQKAVGEYEMALLAGSIEHINGRALHRAAQALIDASLGDGGCE